MSFFEDLVTGRLFSKDEDKKAQDALNRAAEQFAGVEVPELQDLDLEEFVYEGDVDPRLIQRGPDVNYQNINANLMKAALAGDTEMKNISIDPRLRDAQMSALAQLTEIAEAGGLTAEDQANLSRIQSQTAQADRGRREAILQNMAARGMGGSGNELLAQLQSSQAATDRQAQEGLDVAAMAQRRALEAMMQSGNMGGQIRGQDFGEQSATAQAQDAINRFNAANQTSANQFNANSLNNMGQFNAQNQLQTALHNNNQAYDALTRNTAAQNQMAVGNRDARQNVRNNNTEVRNREETYNKVDKPQNTFQNRMQKAGGQAGVLSNQAGYWGDQANSARAGWGNMIQGGAQIGAAAASTSDKRAKKNVKNVDSIDIDQFLAKLSPKKFEYKDKADGEGQHTGVMAQDLQKSSLGQEAVVDMGDGKLGYDVQKMIGIQLAALKHLADKIDKKDK